MSDGDDSERSLRRRFRRISTLQQRFEESRVGEVVISVVVAVVVVVSVAFNLPDSPIKRSVLPVVGPVAAATYLNQEWALFAPVVPTRTETIEVQVSMADGSIRVWTFHPGNPLTHAFSWVRWKRLTTFAVTKPEIRPGIARWAARQVTDPSDHPVHVAMVLRVQNLPPPAENANGASAAKTLYEEDLTGQR
jgi:hypothetical protein